MTLKTDEYFRGVNEIKGKLEQIIQLLEVRNSIYQGQLELKVGEYVPDPFVPCTCHKKGQTSAVEVCPLHG